MVYVLTGLCLCCCWHAPTGTCTTYRHVLWRQTQPIYTVTVMWVLPEAMFILFVFEHQLCLGSDWLNFLQFHRQSAPWWLILLPTVFWEYVRIEGKLCYEYLDCRILKPMLLRPLCAAYWYGGRLIPGLHTEGDFPPPAWVSLMLLACQYHPYIESTDSDNYPVAHMCMMELSNWFCRLSFGG